MQLAYRSAVLSNADVLIVLSLRTGAPVGNEVAIFVRATCSCQLRVTSGRLMSEEPPGELTAGILICLLNSSVSMYRHADVSN